MSIENLKDEHLRAYQKVEGFSQACGLIDLLEASGFEAYFVGGCVRDMLLDRELKDFDMCTSATPDQMKTAFKDHKLLLQGEDFGTVSVVLDGTSYEITSFRGDGVYSDSRHPDSVEFKTSLIEDLKRRDFTVNALAFHPKKGVVDLVDGLKDLSLKILKTVGDPKKRFDEDALRIARLIRFSVQLGFEIDQRTFEAAVEKADALKKVSVERVYTELKKMLDGQPNFESLDKVFKTSFNEKFSSYKNLNLFEKAFIASELGEILDVSTKDYLLEKKLKDRFLSLAKLSSSEDIKTDFIKVLDKYEIDGEDQARFWSLVSVDSPTLKNLKVSPYTKALLSKEIEELKGLHQGRDLGDAIVKLKIKTFFG